MGAKRWFSAIAIFGLSCGLVVASGAAAGGAPRGRIPVDGTAALARVLPRASSRVAATPPSSQVGLQSWHGSFDQGGKNYPYTMLGTDPALGSQTTQLHIRILPLRLTFADGGVTLDPTDRISEVEGSPIFGRARYRSGNTQYGDAMQRSSFWDDVQAHSPGYHLLLSKPTVFPTLSLTVPVGAGHGYQTANGPAGAIKTAFLLTLLPQISNYYDPSVGLIIVVKDVRGEDFLGFHFSVTPAGQTLPQTFIWTGYFTPGVAVGSEHADVYVLSHEVAEWINDPYLTNLVPVWNAPNGPACFNNLLETGDPVEFLPHPSFEVVVRNRTFHVTDTAGISWFAHDVPSRQLGGAYSYAGESHVVLDDLLTAMDQAKLAGLFDVRDRVVIITGGTRGIGRAVAEGFASGGARVVVASRKADACAETEAHLRSLGAEALGVPTHAGDLDALAGLVDATVDTFGGVDIVVNNAANALTQPLGQFTPEAWQKSFDVNLRGPVFLVQAALPHLERSEHAAIVNVISAGAFLFSANVAMYGAAKAALMSFTRSMAADFAPRGIRVNALAPGTVDTDMVRANPPEAQQAMANASPMRRAAHPDEMVGPVLFLASDASSFMTGQVLLVDGGLTPH